MYLQKNKRRCDGFAPCSNCEFSSRPCLYVNAQGETIPPPRTRESFGMSTAASGSAHGGSHPMSKAGSGQSQGQGYGSSQDDQIQLDDGGVHPQQHRGSRGVKHEVPERRKTVTEVVESNPILSTELIDSKLSDSKRNETQLTMQHSFESLHLSAQWSTQPHSTIVYI
jgi:hypothetical protein